MPDEARLWLLNRPISDVFDEPETHIRRLLARCERLETALSGTLVEFTSAMDINTAVIKQLEADNVTLRDSRPNIKALDKMLHRTTTEQAKTIEALQRQVERLRKYTKHRVGCDYYYPHEIGRVSCACGLKQAIEGEGDVVAKTIPPDMLPSDEGGLAQKLQKEGGTMALSDKDKRALQCVSSSHTDKEYEELKRQMERWPGIKIADGTVWLVFSGAIISIDAIGAGRGPIVKKNLRAWRDKILEGDDDNSISSQEALEMDDDEWIGLLGIGGDDE